MRRTFVPQWVKNFSSLYGTPRSKNINDSVHIILEPCSISICSYTNRTRLENDMDRMIWTEYAHILIEHGSRMIWTESLMFLANEVTVPRISFDSIHNIIHGINL